MKSWETTETLVTLSGRPCRPDTRVGDLTIGFHTDQPASSRCSSGPWSLLVGEPEWRLWGQPPSAGWNGYPLTEIRAAGWHIWLLGELYGMQGATQERAQALVDIVRGQRAASQLNGHLLLWAWEEGWRRWHLWTNRFGTLHSYYAHHGGCAVIGTSFRAVAQVASRRQLDWTALTGFFGFGFFPEDRTFYEDVRILRPATHYVFSAQGEEISAQRYWEWRHAPDLERSFDDTVAEFASIFDMVMAGLLGHGPQTQDYGLRPTDYGSQTTDCGPRAIGLGEQSYPTAAASRQSSVVGGLEGRIAIPISGGLDSRCTVAAVRGLRDHGTTGLPDCRPEEGGRKMEAGKSALEVGQYWSYSYGYAEDSVETRIARQVAAARKLPFVPFTIEPYLFDRLDRILGAVEGFQDLTQCRQAFVVETLGQNANYVIAAHWGDVWLEEMGLAGRGRRDDGTTGLRDNGTKAVVSGQWSGSQHSGSQVLAHTLKKMSKQGRAWLLENLCAPWLGKESPERRLGQFVKAGLDRLQHIEDPDFRVKAFKTDHWSFRWTLASLRMFQAAAFPRLPFYDTRLADFFATVPSACMRGRQLQIEYLKRFAPDLARIEWQARGANLYHCQEHDLWQLPKRAVHKALRLMTGRKRIERNWEVQLSSKQGQAGLQHWLLRPGLRLHELVPRGKIATLMKDFKSEPLREGRGYTICMLLTFSVWLQEMETTDYRLLTTDY